MRTVLQESAHSSPKSVDNVRQLAVYDNDGVLLAMMWERDDGTTALTRAGEPDFERLAAQMNLGVRTDVRCVTL